MSNTNITIKVGTRSSNLAILQARTALDRIEEMIPAVKFEMIELSSPGDRDTNTDLRESPQDFFTSDLDKDVLSGDLDCAVHSAKDLPDPMPEGIDWFWLPWREDPRDAIILPKGQAISDLPPSPSVGISSDRRESWCLKRFPDAELNNIRGNIESRIEQLDNGDYDMIVMAVAALNRLGLQDRITEMISLEELPPPDGQGYLAVTFKSGNETLMRIRSAFVKAVDFIGAGIGKADMCTLAGIKAIKNCDVCLHDTLMPQSLVDLAPADAIRIDSGKRCGDHHLDQNAINRLIAEHARRGRKVVRLKGGDPGIFGRLAEEAETLDNLHLPYRAIPGISSLQMATTPTGMLMTRRGLSKGFCVMTPRERNGGISPIKGADRAKLPIAFFMASKAVPEVAKQLIEDGINPDIPAAIVYSAGTDEEQIIRSTLSGMHSEILNLSAETISMPGLLLIGETTSFSYSSFGALSGDKVLLTCSEALQEKAIRETENFGGKPISFPLIQLRTLDSAKTDISSLNTYDWVVVTSPSAARCFFDIIDCLKLDIRSMPKVLVCGTGSAMEFEQRGIIPDAMPESGFSAEAVIAAIRPELESGAKVLRLRSDKAGPSLASELSSLGANVTDCVLYENSNIDYEQVPAFDSVFFASASSVTSFIEQFGAEQLSGKTILSIGIPTAKELEKAGLDRGIIGREATVESALETLAAHYVNRLL